MHEMTASLAAIEPAISQLLRSIGTAIDVLGVVVIVGGIVGSVARFLSACTRSDAHDVLRIQIGQSLLLGLEVLVAADIVKTIALDLTFGSVGALAALILVRTFLSWTLVLEIEGRWPWQRRKGSCPEQIRPA